MTWIHNEIEITMQGPKFHATCLGVNILKPSLSSVKKAIDKLLEDKAAAATINLPVVILRRPRSSFGVEDKPVLVENAVITGVDPATHTVLGIEPPDGYQNVDIIPDSKTNVALLRRWAQVSVEYKALRDRLRNLNISLWSEDKASYGKIVDDLQKRYNYSVAESERGE
jgi:hypothetical protein